MLHDDLCLTWGERNCSPSEDKHTVWARRAASPERFQRLRLGRATATSLGFSRSFFCFLRSFRQRFTGLEPRPIACGCRKLDFMLSRRGRLTRGLIGRVSSGEGSFSRHAAVVRVLVAAPAARADGASAALGAGEGDRDPAAAASAAGAGA